MGLKGMEGMRTGWGNISVMHYNTDCNSAKTLKVEKVQKYVLPNHDPCVLGTFFIKFSAIVNG